MIRRLLVLLLVVGIALSSLSAMAAVPVLIAYDAAIRPAATTVLREHDAVRPEAERPDINAYDALLLGYGGRPNVRVAPGVGALHAYDGCLDLTERREVAEGLIYAAPAATAAAEGALRFGANDLVYGPSAGGALRALQESAGGRLLTDVGGPAAGQSWAEFSTQVLEEHVASGGAVRFDLTHVQDLPGVLGGTGQFANTVTGSELRFVQSNWGTFQGNVTFYSSGAEVAVPW